LTLIAHRFLAELMPRSPYYFIPGAKCLQSGAPACSRLWTRNGAEGRFKIGAPNMKNGSNTLRRTAAARFARGKPLPVHKREPPPAGHINRPHHVSILSLKAILSTEEFKFLSDCCKAMIISDLQTSFTV
jgi:hypothetical protein